MSKAERRADDGPSSTFFRSVEEKKMPTNIIPGLMCCASVLHACKCTIILGTQNTDRDILAHYYLVNDE